MPVAQGVLMHPPRTAPYAHGRPVPCQAVEPPPIFSCQHTGRRQPTCYSYRLRVNAMIHPTLQSTCDCNHWLRNQRVIAIITLFFSLASLGPQMSRPASRRTATRLSC